MIISRNRRAPGELVEQTGAVSEHLLKELHGGAPLQHGAGDADVDGGLVLQRGRRDAVVFGVMVEPRGVAARHLLEMLLQIPQLCRVIELRLRSSEDVRQP